MLAIPDQVGLYADDTGACVECKFGHYCAGTGEAVPCPKNSTTTSAGRSIDDCICMAGFYSVDDETRCQPCQRGKYKPNIGNGECPLTCPTSASSDLGGAGLEDCFCQPGFHAITDNGVLARCAMCDYTGLICLGGFEGSNLTSLDGQPVPRTHAQPIAEPLGFDCSCRAARELAFLPLVLRDKARLLPNRANLRRCVRRLRGGGSWEVCNMLPCIIAGRSNSPLSETRVTFFGALAGPSQGTVRGMTWMCRDFCHTAG